MSDVVDLDPTGHALTTLADDFADPGDETAACPSMWPLFAVPDATLSPLDREARDRHLARCARCRVTLAEALLDDGDGALALTAASKPTPMPIATALPELRDRRRRTTRIVAGLAVAAAAAASLFTIVLPMTHHAAQVDAGEQPLVGPRAHRNPLMPSPEPPLDLIVIVEATARDAASIPAIDAAIADLPVHVPARTTFTLAIASHGELQVVGKQLSASAVAGMQLPPPTGAAIAPLYEQILPAAGALLPDPSHRRAILLIGEACSPWDSPNLPDLAVDRLRQSGVAIEAVTYRYAECRSAVLPRYYAHGVADLGATTAVASGTLVAAASGPPPLKLRPPIDLLILIDGHGLFLGDAADTGPSAYADVRLALDGIDPHVPAHSGIRFATVVGDTVTMRGVKEFPNVPVDSASLGPSHDYANNIMPPRYAAAIDRARHLLADRNLPRALLLIGSGCELDADEAAERTKQIHAAIDDGIAVRAITYRPEALAGCVPFWDPADPALPIHRADLSSSLPGLVADALDDFSAPRDDSRVISPQFIHHTPAAP